MEIPPIEGGSRLKPFVIRCSLFLCLASLSYLLTVFAICNLNSDLYYFVRKYTNVFTGSISRGDSTLLRLREVEKTANIDILFLGSSHCYRGFDTRIFERYGLKSFNLGTTAQSPINSYYLLAKHIWRLKPKLIVMELYWHVLSSDGMESFIDIASNSELDMSLIKMCFSINNLRAYNNVLFNLFKINLKPTREIKAKLKNGDRYQRGGFVESGKSEYHPDHDMNTFNIRLNPKQMAYIEKIIGLARDAKSQIVFVTTPVADAYMNSIQNYEFFTDTVSRIAIKFQVPFFDFNRNQELSLKEYYFDSDHLNQNGVKLFDNMVYDTLKKAQLIPNSNALLGGFSGTRFIPCKY
jgi:hypothetical protein